MTLRKVLSILILIVFGGLSFRYLAASRIPQSLTEPQPGPRAIEDVTRLARVVNKTNITTHAIKDFYVR